MEKSILSCINKGNYDNAKVLAESIVSGLTTEPQLTLKEKIWFCDKCGGRNVGGYCLCGNNR